MLQARTQTPPPPPTYASKLMHVMEGLASTMEDEIALLEKRIFTPQAEILRKKQELTLDYQSTLKYMEVAPDKSALFTPAEKATVQAMGKKLEETTQRNAEALRLAQATSERLLHMMMNEVRKELHREGGYSKGAVLTVNEKGATRPVAYSQRV